MTEKTVQISITTKINGKATSKEITAEASNLDGEMIKMMIEVLKEAITGGLEAIDDQIREREAKDWKNLGREKHRVITAVGEVEIKRRVYRDGGGKRRKPLDEMMGLERYQRETNVVRMLGAWLATQNSYRDAADELSYVVATGYGRINVPFADRQITEISAHARGIGSLLSATRIVIDIGGQDCKGIKLANGRVLEFVMNDKCAAGTGRFLEVISEALGVRLEEMGELSLTSVNEVSISNTCTVFAEQEIVSKLAEGTPVADLVAGVHKAIATRVSAMVSRLKIEPDIVVTGGGAKNIGLVKALEAKLGHPVITPPEPLITGAIGAAFVGKDTVRNAAERGQPLTRSCHPLQPATFFTEN